MGDRREADLRSAGFTYAEVGATRDAVLPPGFRTFHRSVLLPAGVDLPIARSDLLSWMVQLRAGIRVQSSGDVTPQAVVDLRVGVGPLSLRAPCRVVYVIDEPGRCGFAYGTLPGHPESGEESFLLTSAADTAVTFTISAFSRPASALSARAGPIGRRFQDLITARYLRTFD